MNPVIFLNRLREPAEGRVTAEYGAVRVADGRYPPPRYRLSGRSEIGPHGSAQSLDFRPGPGIRPSAAMLLGFQPCSLTREALTNRTGFFGDHRAAKPMGSKLRSPILPSVRARRSPPGIDHPGGFVLPLPLASAEERVHDPEPDAHGGGDHVAGAVTGDDLPHLVHGRSASALGRYGSLFREALIRRA